MKCIHLKQRFGRRYRVVPEVVKIMRPRLRRKVSEAERERLRQMGFRKGQNARPDVEQTARKRDPAVVGDSEPVGQQMALFEP